MRRLKVDSRSGGYTMVEILVVMGIIVVVAALAVPAISVLSGSRSIDGASNMISSMMGSARSEAISRQTPVGLAIFEDADQERVGVALVAGPQPWADGVSYVRGDFVSYADTTGTTYYYHCARAHQSRRTATTTDDRPPEPTSGTVGSWTRLDFTGTPEAAYAGGEPRRYLTTEYVSVLPETDVMYLPPGVGAQVVNAARTSGAGAASQCDRYLRSSVIFFGGDGRMAVNRRFGILNNAGEAVTPGANCYSSRLGALIKFNQKNGNTSVLRESIDPVPGANSDTLTSGLGVILYDRAAYLSQLPPGWDSQFWGTAYSAVTAPAAKSEQDAESWLDANGTVLMINRFNGAVLKTE